MRQDGGDKKPKQNKGMTRRSFIKGMGAGAAAVAASGPLLASASPRANVLSAEDMHLVTLNVNGRLRQVLVEARWSLLFVLREELGLTGAKAGCERGECGSCTVLFNGAPRYSCLTLAVEAEGASIITVEGLMEGEALGPVQQAFVAHDAFQCGYCTPGQIMAAEGLLRTHPEPTIAQIQKGMSGNLCRCGAYAHIFKAVTAAAKNRIQT